MSAEVSLGLIVFIAIMLHKAPSAFGLVSFLLQQGYTKREARAYLVAFSAAAPVGAAAAACTAYVSRLSSPRSHPAHTRTLTHPNRSPR